MHDFDQWSESKVAWGVGQVKLNVAGVNFIASTTASTFAELLEKKDPDALELISGTSQVQQEYQELLADMSLERPHCGIDECADESGSTVEDAESEGMLAADDFYSDAD